MFGLTDDRGDEKRAGDDWPTSGSKKSRRRDRASNSADASNPMSVHIWRTWLAMTTMLCAHSYWSLGDAGGLASSALTTPFLKRASGKEFMISRTSSEIVRSEERRV